MSETTKRLDSETSSDIHSHFPFPAERPTQTQALDAVARTFRSDKKFFILEGPTGFGKSGIGVAAGSWAKTWPALDGGTEAGSYILSPQKTLTAQYMKDFEPMGLVELKGQANYYCPSFDSDCETASLIHEEDHNRDSCFGYKPAKARFLSNPLGVTNFSYYLNETQHAGQLTDRNLLVLDEGHNTEDQILGFTDTEINRKRCDEYGLVGRLPMFDDGDNVSVLDWLTGTFVPLAQTYFRDLERKLKQAREAGNTEERAKVARKMSATDKFITRIGLFTNSTDHRDWFSWSDKESGTLTIKPLTATLFADDILFSKAEKILIMSATILDFGTFMRNLGITRANSEVLAVDSEFPLENRPIFYRPVGNMRHKDIDTTLPLMAARLDELMQKYWKHKGIVHTHSYKINRYLTDYLISRGFGNRIITHDNSKGARDYAQERHLASSEPTVLFSPSMTEGLDLKEDLSRWQVITKVPYPALTPYIKARSQRDPDWYQWLTGLKLVQATGRSVRSRTDKAHTHILDSGFGDFLNRNNRRMPKYWTDSIIF